MDDLFKQTVSVSLFGKCVAAVVGILIIHATFRVLEQTLPRRFGRADSRYKVRKFVVFSGYISILLSSPFSLKIAWTPQFRHRSVGAGVAVAPPGCAGQPRRGLFHRVFKALLLGDRIQIGDTRGDVIDIGLLRTTLMETGDWVSGDLYNGRIARIPNSAVLKGPVFNYSQGFRFIRDEIKVVFHDCQRLASSRKRCLPGG